MYDHERIAKLLDQRLPGHSLPQKFYVDPCVYEFDLDAIFHRGWKMVGFEAELTRAGSYLATMIGRTPIVVLRNKQDHIVGFHNSCRHRGAQICKNGAGRVPRLVCPYHQWAYGLDGKLLSARGADDSFDTSTHGLIPIRVEAVAGCIYVALTDDAPDFGPFRRALEPALRPHNLHQLKVAHSSELHENANWKLVMENARECHHCSARHPEFMTAVPLEIIESGTPFPEDEAASPFMRRMRELGLETAGYTEDWWQIGRIRFKEGVVSFSMDGKPLVNKPLTDLNEGNLGSLRWAIEPNNFCHVTSDSVVMFNANPTGPLTTLVTAKWLVHKDAVEGVDYNIDRLTFMWNQTNLQDRELAENNQCGVNGVGYRPGPYSRKGEPYILRFVDWYVAEARKFLSEHLSTPGG
jgi:Rieske 2Fe-2S family protein